MTKCDRSCGRSTHDARSNPEENECPSPRITTTSAPPRLPSCRSRRSSAASAATSRRWCSAANIASPMALRLPGSARVISNRRSEQELRTSMECLDSRRFRALFHQVRSTTIPGELRTTAPHGRNNGVGAYHRMRFGIRPEVHTQGEAHARARARGMRLSNDPTQHRRPSPWPMAVLFLTFTRVLGSARPPRGARRSQRRAVHAR